MMCSEEKPEPGKFHPNAALMQGFLKDEQHRIVYEQAERYPSEANIQKLNSAFQRFYTEIQLTNYLTMTLSYYARNYSKQAAVHQGRELAVLDQPAGEEQETSKKDMLVAREDQTVYSWEQAIHDPALLTAIQDLPNKQKEYLELHFIHQLTHTEIAETLDISQQAVSKSIQSALRKLRSVLPKGDAP
ncbi:sigma-70 family RNA polymerase sigma factor [Terribacillus saccharophilus]|uniref:sigma-70 family RNA polymerase sigma factor n=1 Tax=Terribacillus saccharophilus TaxID=361277 RepID=UPI0039824DD5